MVNQVNIFALASSSVNKLNIIVVYFPQNGLLATLPYLAVFLLSFIFFISIFIVYNYFPTEFVIFPLFPALLGYYVQLEGQASLIGRLVELLSFESATPFTVVVLFGGVQITMFAGALLEGERPGAQRWIGMGLAMAYGCVDNHNGWIYVESDANKGSEFFVFLPRATAFRASFTLATHNKKKRHHSYS